MLIKALRRGLELRPMMQADSPAGASQAQTPAASDTSSTNAPAAPGSAETTPPAPEAGTGDESAAAAAAASAGQANDPPAATDEPAATDTEIDADASATPPADLTLDQWRDKARNNARQAASYRTQRNNARDELATANARIAELEQTATQAAAPDPVAEATARAELAERQAAIVTAAAAASVPISLIQAMRQLDTADDDASRQAAIELIRPHLKPITPGLGMPPADTTGGPTLQQQIAQAEASGDTRKSIMLKSAMIPRPK